MVEEEDYVCLEAWFQSTAIPHCSPQSLQAGLQLVNIQTLAFTPPHTLPWRVYLYTHAQHGHSGDAPRSTLILGELLHTGEANNKAGAKKGMCDGEVGVEGMQAERVREGVQTTDDGLSGKESVRKEEGVKVTLKQQPRDDQALKGFLSILKTVLHTLSSERN